MGVCSVIQKDIACIFGVTNYPSEWVKKYQEQGLQYIDPVVLTARNRLTPFAWDEQIMADAGLHFPELFEQAREFGVTHGYTFVLHDYNDNLVTLSFAFNVEQRAEAIQALTDRKGDRYCWPQSMSRTWRCPHCQKKCRIPGA